MVERDKNGHFIKGHTVPNEYREAVRQSNITREMTDHHRLAISEANSGKVRTTEHRLNYRTSKLGEKNPQYINGKFERKVDKYIRELKEYVDWRHAVFERDSYTCKVCGKHNCELNAHHVIPFVMLVGELRNKNKNEIILQAKQYEKLWDVDNGITLCLSCHYKTHTRTD
jgi:5-methylcytosine-specific restriction endonuclease McrA